MTSQENFLVTDHGKVQSIKCNNEKKSLAQKIILILYDEK